MSLPTSQGTGPTPLADEVHDIGDLEAQVVAELRGESAAPAETPDAAPPPPSDIPAQYTGAPAPAPEATPPAPEATPPAPEATPPAPPAADDKPPEGVKPEALEYIERRDAAARAKIEQERESMVAEVQRRATEVKQQLMEQYPSEVLQRAQEIAALQSKGLNDRALAEYYFNRDKRAAGETGYDPDAVVAKHQTAHASSAREKELQERLDRMEAYILNQEGHRKLQPYVEAATPDTHPHVARWIKAYPDEAKNAIAQQAVEYQQQYGILPTSKEVLDSLEKEQQRRAEAFGYTLPAEAKPAVPSKAQTPAPQAPAAISSDLQSSTPTGQDPDDLDELEAVVIEELKQMRAASEF